MLPLVGARIPMTHLMPHLAFIHKIYNFKRFPERMYILLLVPK